MPKEQAAKEKLLDAALSLIREKGYAAMTVDELCARAGVTKGAFFYYFKSKEELGVAAADHWSAVTGQVFEQASYHSLEDPLDRLLTYIDFRRLLLHGELPQVTCVAGTMVQEVYSLHPEIRDACAASIFGHAETLVHDIEAAISKYKPTGDWSAQSLANYTQAVLQGAFVLAKANNDVTVALESVDHLKRYVEMLFQDRTSQA